jgi:cell division protease FtsH
MDSQHIQDLILTWAPLVFFGVIVVLLVMTLRFMPRTKPVTIDKASSGTVVWADIAGVDEAKAELVEAVEFLKDRRRFERLGARIPSGMLLYGPPGTGKTLLAKAVAQESGANFYSASASSFVEMFAGLGAARIRRLFKEARKNAPAIIFIDELDAVGLARQGTGHNREQDQTLNQLLVELDGFGGREDVIVMGASNRLQDLDPALLRPGRFDRQVHVSAPDVLGREAILRVHTRSKPLAADVDLAVVARRTAGLTGAELANIANEAAIFAARKGRQHVHMADFDGALERVITGIQKRRVVTEKEKRILAYHEGGHALMAYLMGELMPIQKVTIVGRGDALGLAYYLPTEDRYLHTKEELMDVMKVALAGRAAEQVVFGRVTNGAASDLEKVTEIARSMVFDYGMSSLASARTVRADNYALSEETKRMRDAEQARLTDDAYEEAQRLIEKHRAPLDRIAMALLEKETLDRTEYLALMGDVPFESASSETVGTIRVLPSVDLPASSSSVS